ncbi:hypothetical protein BW686_05735 [Pseudomonas syringae]|uniref:Uncharacterized protein n=1 Tax=Pseudomonas syringae TaxID=317 RepID=A0A244EUU0_PSESX|nr:hypothetical protein BW686_05735 [Pseudomonas syringae]
MPDGVRTQIKRAYEMSVWSSDGSYRILTTTSQRLYERFGVFIDGDVVASSGINARRVLFSFHIVEIS